MPYELIPLIASVVLAVRYLRIGDASSRSKAVVALVVVASLVVRWRYPALALGATLAQVAVSIGILIYLRIN
jgi:hypothetical protein